MSNGSRSRRLHFPCLRVQCRLPCRSITTSSPFCCLSILPFSCCAIQMMNGGLARPCNKQIKHSQNQNAIWLEIQVVLVGATPPHTINNTPKGKKFIGLKIYIYKTCLSCIFTMYTVPPVKHSSWKFCIASAVGWVVPFCEGKTGGIFFSVSACVIAWV